jgi:3-phosphoglycerate kinase
MHTLHIITVSKCQIVRNKIMITLDHLNLKVSNSKIIQDNKKVRSSETVTHLLNNKVKVAVKSTEKL